MATLARMATLPLGREAREENHQDPLIQTPIVLSPVSLVFSNSSYVFWVCLATLYAFRSRDFLLQVLYTKISSIALC